MVVRPAYLLGISPRAAWLISGRRLEVLPAAFWSAETGPVQAASAAVPAPSPRAESRWRRVRERSCTTALLQLFCGGAVDKGRGGRRRPPVPQAFSAPAARPPMRRRWARKKTASIGRATITVPAITGPQES